MAVMFKSVRLGAYEACVTWSTTPFKRGAPRLTTIGPGEALLHWGRLELLLSSHRTVERARSGRPAGAVRVLRKSREDPSVETHSGRGASRATFARGD